MPFLSPAARAALDLLTALEHGAPEAVSPLERVSALRTLLAALDSDPAVLAAVREALDAGEPWERIAAAAGLGTGAAKWRWQGTDGEITARAAAGRKRSARPSSVPTDLPGHSVAEAAQILGVTAQAVYLRITRGTLTATTVVLDDGRSYKRVML